MKVLVTGGAGFIGSHVIRLLQKRGDIPVVLDNLSSGSAAHVPSDIPLITMDITDKAVKDVFAAEQFDAIVHLAAQTMVNVSMEQPYMDMEQNISGLVNVLECARAYGVKRVIFSSSAATYGNVGEESLPIAESQSQVPTSFYGLTKMTAEKYLAMYHDAFGLDYVVLRFANVYGERQGDAGEGGVISIFTKRMAEGKGLTVYGDGSQTRDFVYAGDVAAAIYAALHTMQVNTVYNVSTQTEISLSQLVALLADVAGRPVHVAYEPARQGDIYRSVLSNEKAKKYLAWKPEVSFYEGLRRTYQYMSCHAYGTVGEAKRAVPPAAILAIPSAVLGQYPY